MADVGLDTRLRMVRHSLPALVHFDFKQLRVPIGRPIRSLRVYLPQRGVLNLRGLELQMPVAHSGEKQAAPSFGADDASFRMSSRAAASGAPEDAFKGRGLITEAEALPYWEMRLRRPLDVRALLVTNRRGATAARNASLRVDYEDADGNVWTYDNAGDEAMAPRIRLFEAEAAKLHAEDWHGGDADVAARLQAVAATASRLTTALRAALRGKGWSQEAMEADRVDLIQRITDLVQTAPLEIKRAALPRAAAVLEYLLYRGVDREAPQGSDTEALAVGIIFAAIFVRDQKVANRKLRENQRFVQNPERAKFIDGYVSDTYFEMTGDDSLFPIMIRSHGLTGSNLLRNPHEYVATLKEIETIFARHGYQLAICYGTFLGAYREKSFIPHDDDLDTALLLKSTTMEAARGEMAELIQALRAEGVAIEPTATGFMKIRAPSTGHPADIFPVIPRDADTVHMVMQKLRFRDVPRDVVLPFGKIMFYDTEFLCPAQGPRFLEERYGPTWHIPLRQVGGKTIPAETGLEGVFEDFG